MNNPDKFIYAIARQWGLRSKDPCDNRKGIVMTFVTGKWEPLAYDDAKGTKPMVCDCAHEGLSVISSCMLAEFIAASIEGREYKFRPEDFQFKYLDDQDVVKDTREACEILSTIKGKP